VEKAIDFVEKIRKVRTALKKVQEEIKKQANRKQKEVEEWKKEHKVMLNIKDLVFKERPVNKKICKALYDKKNCFKECSEVKAADLYKNSSSSEYQ